MASGQLFAALLGGRDFDFRDAYDRASCYRKLAAMVHDHAGAFASPQEKACLLTVVEWLDTADKEARREQDEQIRALRKEAL